MSLNLKPPAEDAIRYHSSKLKHCWIITGGPASEAAANSMIQRLIADGLSPDVFHMKKLKVDEVDNPAGIYECIEGIFNSLPDEIKESDIISDYTGGTKSMTAGMILSCALPSRKLQFMKPEKYKDDGTAALDSQKEPREIDIRFGLKRVNR